MPPTQNPCANCKDKHVKCDGDQSHCRRCAVRGLPCHRPQRRTAFRPGSSARYDARFSGDQRWVGNAARQFRLQVPKSIPCENHSHQTDPTHSTPSGGSGEGPYEHRHRSENSNETPVLGDGSPTSSQNGRSYIALNSSASPSSPLSGQLSDNQAPVNANFGSEEEDTPSTQTNTDSPSVANIPLPPAFQHIQEACLFRYFVEEHSRWFDIADDKKRFERVVPLRAGQYPPMLCAIFATSARHLCRRPEYRTLEGISYHNQLLPRLDESIAVEYMLKCIPGLAEFDSTQNAEKQEMIITTAVFLRQFEEMETEETEGVSYHEFPSRDASVNFLDVINAVMRSTHSTDLLYQRPLFNAAYWMALRQEVYYSFIRGHSPQLLISDELWGFATPVNKVIIHTSQVAKWFWEGKSQDKWLKLKEQEASLKHLVMPQFAPFFSRTADKSRGEVFPTLWCSSDVSITALQHFKISQMVLAAESPSLLNTQDRTATRITESCVRSLVFDTCAIAVHHPRLPPALVYPIIALALYGNYFTDSWERKALAGVIDRFRHVRAWPVPSVLGSFDCD